MQKQTETTKKTELEILEASFYKEREKMQKKMLREQLPALRKKYEGKCFKFRDSYGSGEEWWLYYRVLKVRDLRYCACVSFQSTSLSVLEVNKNNILPLGMLDDAIPITRHEYNTALRSFYKKIQNIL